MGLFKMLTVFNIIIFINICKVISNYQIYPIIQDVAKFRSQCKMCKLNFYPDLEDRNMYIFMLSDKTLGLLQY